MATKRESKPAAQSVTEYVLKRVLRHGEQGVFSHPSEASVRAVHAQCVADDAKSGCVHSYNLVTRTVSGDDVDEQEQTL